MFKQVFGIAALAMAIMVGGACNPTQDVASTTKALSGPYHTFIFSGQSRAPAAGNKSEGFDPVPSWAQNSTYYWDGTPPASPDTGIVYKHPGNNSFSAPPAVCHLPYRYNGNFGGTLAGQPNAWGPCIGYRPTNTTGGLARDSALGPDLSFLYRYQADFPDHNVALLKNAVGGSGIDEWLPPSAVVPGAPAGAYWNLLVAQINDAKARFAAAGEAYVWEGFVWIHGENGASTVYPYLHPTAGQEYSDKLRALIAGVRALTRADLPVVLSRVDDSMLADNIILPLVGSGENTAANLRGATINRQHQQDIVAGDFNVNIASPNACPFALVGGVCPVNPNLPIFMQDAAQYRGYHQSARGMLGQGERLYVQWKPLAYPVAGDGGVDAGPDAGPDYGPEAPPPLVTIVKRNGVVQTGWSVEVLLNGVPVPLPGGNGDTREFLITTP